MLFELAQYLTDFLGICFRAAFGKNDRGHPDPDNPTNRRGILVASLAWTAILSVAAFPIAWAAFGSLTAALLTSLVVLGIGIIAAWQAV